MKTQQITQRSARGPLLVLTILLPFAVCAQVPVDEDGSPFTVYSTDPEQAAIGDEDIPLLSTVDLEELVGPIALYPDDLLAIILPASAYPLQIVDAARFLEALEDDPTLEPNSEWDDAVVALLNYPEVVEFLNDDIDWTWRLGEAVVAQQADVVAAVEAFRDRAYAAGNLKSDDHQRVARNNGVIEITPTSDDVIYVPYYEPDRVVVYQPRPVYYYYPRAYPVYYYPYPSAYRFDNDWFWGVTTTFRIGWFSDSLHVLHHSYYGHPYFGRSYYDRWWYRRPSISTHNVIYVGGNSTTTVNRYYGGDRWRPRHDRRDYLDHRRFSRNHHERFTPRRELDNERSRSGVRRTERTNVVRQGGSRQRPARLDGSDAGNVRQRHQADRDPITFRQRPEGRTAVRGARPVEDTRRGPKEVAVRRDSESRWQPSRRSERPTHTASRRQQRDYRTVERSTSRHQDGFTTAKRQNVERRHAEPAPKVARAAPSARSERRTENVKRPQVRREELSVRSTTRSSSPPPAPAERKTYQTRKSDAGKASRKVGRLAVKNDRRR